MLSDNCLESHSGVNGDSACIGMLKCSDNLHTPFCSLPKPGSKTEGKVFPVPRQENAPTDAIIAPISGWAHVARTPPPPPPEPTRCRAAPSPAKTLSSAVVRRDRLSVPKRKAHHVAYHRSAYAPTLGPSPVAAAYPPQTAYQIKLVSPEIHCR